MQGDEQVLCTIRSPHGMGKGLLSLGQRFNIHCLEARTLVLGGVRALHSPTPSVLDQN